MAAIPIGTFNQAREDMFVLLLTWLIGFRLIHQLMFSVIWTTSL
jgi:hypothetical protein